MYGAWKKQATTLGNSEFKQGEKSRQTCQTFGRTYACTRCLSVSVGTRTTAERIAPADADTMWVKAWGCFWASSRFLVHSYAQKYKNAVGMVPNTAAVRPKYTSLGPCTPMNDQNQRTSQTKVLATDWWTRMTNDPNWSVFREYGATDKTCACHKDTYSNINHKANHSTFHTCFSNNG